ncbi:MAG TPA: pilus assembly protein TadG-related protein [Candidatus Baltobacteraceae bacterium]|nr:pilus assembly protein TadG-related protein [Candidatus Baltobacteraceae bacterium]
MDNYTNGHDTRFQYDRMSAQRGQTLPLVAVALAVLLGVAGFSVDVGYHQYQQRMQQTATDSAAIAGAKEEPLGDYKAAAQQDAGNNGYTDNSGGLTCDSSAPIGRVCVVVNNPPVAPDAFSSDSRAVEVQITVIHPTWFERVFGINSAAVTTKSVATLKDVTGNNCLFVLNGAANFNGQTGGGTVNAPNCGLVFNGTTSFHNATVTAASIECAATCAQGTFLSATPQPSAPASDPCGAISFCAHMSNPTPSCSSPLSFSASSNQIVTSANIPPGCYSNLNLTKARSAQFGCGLYVITGTLNGRPNGGSNATPVSLTQDCGTGGPNGVTFYLSGNASLDLGNDNINLTAPTTGDYSQYSAGEQNVLIYQAPGDTNTVNMASATCAGCQSFFQGMIYAPSATLNYNQYTTTTSGNVLIVVGVLNANGGINSIFNAPGPQGTYTVQVPYLGE